jgi:CBS-domain-containing membrane protein
MRQTLTSLLGIERNTTSHKEKLLSALGVVSAMLALIAVCIWLLDENTSQMLVISSMGATAVLLFAAPHGALSQPWQVVGGHLLSAVIGVTCSQWIPDVVLASAMAVGLSVLVMTYLGCIHPPGGATALTAVLGGADVQSLGYGFIWAPVMINVAVMLVLAVIYNIVFPWRRYPAYLSHQYLATRRPRPHIRADNLVSQQDIESAMKEMDGYFDVTAEELQDLLHLAMRHAEKRQQDQARQSFWRRALHSSKESRRRRLLGSVSTDRSGDKASLSKAQQQSSDKSHVA